MDAKKEEANKKYAEKGGDIGVRVNVMDIEVNDDFDVDEI